MLTSHLCLITGAILIIILACNTRPREFDLELLSRRVTVLPETETGYALFPCSRKGPRGVTGTWFPTMDDVLAVESLLHTYVARRLDRPLAEYHRQYIGLTIADKRILYIHAFLPPPNGKPIDESLPDWRTRYMAVCDGGKVSWGLEFNTHARKFKNFELNALNLGVLKGVILEKGQV